MLEKQNLPINFAQGLDTKTDPFQVQFGRFLALQNSVFTKGARLSKRNGNQQLQSPPNSPTFGTTFNGDLTVIGPNSISAFASNASQWSPAQSIQPAQLSVLPLIRNNLNQVELDTAISSNGLICTVYAESNGSSNTYKYVVADSTTGQNIVQPTAIPGAEPTYGYPKVFLLGPYFVIVFTNVVTATYHLKYIAISSANAALVTSPVDISTSYTPATTGAFDGAVYNNTLFIAWNGAAASGVKVAYLTPQLVAAGSVSSATNPDAAHVATLMSVTVDTPNAVIWVSYYNSGSSTGYTLALNPIRSVVLAATQIIPSGTVLNLTSVAQNNVLTALYELDNAYSYDSAVKTNIIKSITCTVAGSVGTAATVSRSVGLASKAFLVGTTPYLLAAYKSPYQNTYFLMSGTGQVIGKLAYENGGGYLTTGLPSVSVNGTVAQVGYLFKDLIAAVNKDTNVASGTQTAGIYSQTGINFASFNIGGGFIAAEIGSNLNLTGGFTWAYDGYSATEQNFFLYPDSVEATTSGTGGLITAQQYFYAATYEWTDNQGNAFRSAPSVPISITTTGSTSTNTIKVPTLRLTYKTANPVKIVLYRWSTAQQVYYQVTSITSPTLNDTTIDQVTITDTFADATILGNNIIYTTGGVLEDVGPPSFKSVFLFDDRLWGIESEDDSSLWFSKQVIPATPVEMSDLLTMFVAPNIGAQGPSGGLNCGFPMDDKAILFKSSSILYVNGTGPDNTGSNNQYSQPILVTTTVGCSNQKSIVNMPQGLMFEFQSEAGNQIWILKRDLGTEYIGAPVEALTNGATIQSAVSIPGTNQVRFTLSSGATLVYDYYYGQWDTSVGIPAVSSTLFQGLHTYITSQSTIYQEAPGTYVDGSNPVLMSFTTGWFNLAGLQGYQRAYFFYLLGTYITPFKLVCSIAYDYNPAPVQTTIISPTNFAPTYGGPEANGQNPVYGQGTPYGGESNVLNWRVFLNQQRCSAFQLTIQEVYDPSFGVAAGAGFTLSGINLVYAMKKGFRPQSARHSAGSP